MFDIGLVIHILLSLDIMKTYIMFTYSLNCLGEIL